MEVLEKAKLVSVKATDLPKQVVNRHDGRVYYYVVKAEAKALHDAQKYETPKDLGFAPGGQV